MSFKMPTETKREEFRKYLERTGVMDALTKALVALYEEADKPTDALEYIRNKISGLSEGETIESIKAQLEAANERITVLETENTALRGEKNEEGGANEEEAPAVVEPVE